MSRGESVEHSTHFEPFPLFSSFSFSLFLAFPSQLKATFLYDEFLFIAKNFESNKKKTKRKEKLYVSIMESFTQKQSEQSFTNATKSIPYATLLEVLVHDCACFSSTLACKLGLKCCNGTFLRQRQRVIIKNQMDFSRNKCKRNWNSGIFPYLRFVQHSFVVQLMLQ